MKNKFNYYKLDNSYFISLFDYKDLPKALEEEVAMDSGLIYFLNRLPVLESRRSFSISHCSQLFWEKEDLKILNLQYEEDKSNIPGWLIEKIDGGRLVSINTNYPNWEEIINNSRPKRWKVNLVALGDVGSTLLLGLRLLGGEIIDEIGIYDRNQNRLKRWEYEINQIRRPFDELAFPKVSPVEEKDLFDCDMFIFCASKGIPPVGSQVQDVRMAQFESNSQIISTYAKMARQKDYKGIFAVVSDPVDLLCKVALLESNKNEVGEIDLQGLAPEQIIGYGLGVMNGRACFYAEQSPEMIHYIEEGRVYGPHGEGLIVADSIENYNEEISNYLTERTLKANLEVRGFGYKPFVAPSLSSGSLSLIATMKGDWFYGSTYVKEVYMGAKSRLLASGIEVEQVKLPEALLGKIEETYDKLAAII